MKKIKISLYALAIVILIVFMGVCFAGVNAYETTTTTVVEVKDGVPSKEGFEQTIVLKNGGNYRMYADWKTEPEGMITGFELLNEVGESYNTFTAEWISMESAVMNLPAGKYTLKATYLTNKDDWVRFFEETDTVFDEWDVPTPEDFDEMGYEFSKEATFETTYHFSLKKDVPVFEISIACGMLIGIFLVAILLTLATKGEDKKAKFDERQELVRGRGFKYAFFSMIGYSAVVYGLDLLGVHLYMSLAIASLICVLVGSGVYAVYCIWNDGYFALNQNRGSILVAIGLGGILNLVFGISAMIHNELVVNGQLSIRSMNLFCGIMCVVIWVALFAKSLKDRKEA